MQAQMSPAYPAPLFTSSVLQSILTHPSWRRTKLMINFCISKKGLPPTKPRKNWRKDMTHVCGTRSRVDCTPIPRCNMQRPGQVAPSTQLVTGPQNRDGRANYHLGNPHRWMDGSWMDGRTTKKVKVPNTKSAETLLLQLVQKDTSVTAESNLFSYIEFLLRVVSGNL